MFSWLRRIYGAPVWHALLMSMCLLLAAYAVFLLSGQSLFGSVAMWFVACVVGYDLVLAPSVALVERVLGRIVQAVRGRRPSGVPVINHIRLPLLGSGVLFLVYFPGIVRQGTETHVAASGLGQDPYVFRWVWLCTALIVISFASYVVRVLFRRVQAAGKTKTRIGKAE